MCDLHYGMPHLIVHVSGRVLPGTPGIPTVTSSMFLRTGSLQTKLNAELSEQLQEDKLTRPPLT